MSGGSGEIPALICAGSHGYMCCQETQGLDKCWVGARARGEVLDGDTGPDQRQHQHQHQRPGHVLSNAKS